MAPLHSRVAMVIIRLCFRFTTIHHISAIDRPGSSVRGERGVSSTVWLSARLYGSSRVSMLGEPARLPCGRVAGLWPYGGLVAAVWLPCGYGWPCGCLSFSASVCLTGAGGRVEGDLGSASRMALARPLLFCSFQSVVKLVFRLAATLLSVCPCCCPSG